jgi:hypothetical protein
MQLSSVQSEEIQDRFLFLILRLSCFKFYLQMILQLM